jgi:hypothetical protein
MDEELEIERSEEAAVSGKGGQMRHLTRVGPSRVSRKADIDFLDGRQDRPERLIMFCSRNEFPLHMESRAGSALKS